MKSSVYIILGIILIMVSSAMIGSRLMTAVSPAEGYWERTDIACSSQQACINYMLDNGVSPIFVDWIRCNEGKCEYFVGNITQYTGKVIT